MATTMAKEPVCGMDVDPAVARRTSEYEGRTYYFWAPACKKSFEADPRQYLASESRGDAAAAAARRLGQPRLVDGRA